MPNSSLSTDEIQRIKALLRQTGEFIAYFEMAETKMSSWREDIQGFMTTHQAQTKAELQKIAEQTEQMSQLTTEVGLARWRSASEKTLSNGKEHLNEIKRLSDRNIEHFEKQKKDLLDIANRSINELRRSEALLSHKLNTIVKKAKFDEIIGLSLDVKESIEAATNQSVKQYQKIFKRFRLKTAALILCVSLMSSITIGLFLNAETPWEIHSHAKEERLVGKALLHAWPHLSVSLKGDILHKLHLKRI